MLANKVIALAKKTELRQLAVKDDDVAILGFINRGMIEIYKRFPLKQEEAIITLQEDVTDYLLDGTDPNVSIPNPENFLLVSECYDEQGDPVTVNDENDPLGILTPSYNLVEVPNVAQDEKLSIIYRAAPNSITKTTENIELPAQLQEALLAYMAFLGHASVTGDGKEENNTHFQRFVSSCDRVQELGLVTPDDLESEQWDARGFV